MTVVSSDAEARAALGEVVTIRGTYELREIHGKKGDVFRTWPVVVLPGGGFVALESVWDASKQPSDDEVARWRGQTVEVRGTLHPVPPAEGRKANMSMLTISPVESLGLA
jgi:hypothetical protein